MPDPKQPAPKDRGDSRFDDAPEGEYDAGRGGTRELERDTHGRGTEDRDQPRPIDDGVVEEDDRRPTRFGGYAEPTD